MNIVSRTCVVGLCLALAGSAFADTKASAEKASPAAGKIVFSTKSPEAVKAAEEVIQRIENFQFGPDFQAAAKRSVEADPQFAFGHYLVGVTTPQAQAKPHMDKAAELMKAASDGERRYFEAVMLNRTQKPAEALAAFEVLQKDYPQERMIDMMLGQLYTAQGKMVEAEAAYERALAKAPTPRARALIGNIHLLKEDYATARRHYQAALALKAPKSAPGNVYYGMAFADLYEGNIDGALKTLDGYVKEYKDSGAAQGLPEVFIWNSMARINLENGRTEEALKLYAKGFESVPGSSIDEKQKTIWRGRLHHGTARTLARMGKHEEAWKNAETIKKLIDEGGEDGKPFVEAYHYLAGYLKLEAGDTAAALEHLKQADKGDPFHQLLLARAYEKAGDKASAKKVYAEIVAYKQNNLERALAYPEAKKKLASAS
jgi:tetratricopeptide (TPR) repeat protein